MMRSARPEVEEIMCIPISLYETELLYNICLCAN